VSIEWFRDLVIIIFGLLAIILLILAAVFGYLRYRATRSLISKVDSILDSAKNISGSVEGIFSSARAASGPLMEIVTVIKAVSHITNMFKKKEA
jgi:hypothetical protein